MAHALHFLPLALIPVGVFLNLSAWSMVTDFIPTERWWGAGLFGVYFCCVAFPAMVVSIVGPILLMQLLS